MNGRIILILIVVFNLLARFWKIGEIPQLLDDRYLSPRIISACLGVLTPLILYFFIKNTSGKIKFALLSSLIFSLMPQSIIESRIASSIAQMEFLFLLILLLSSAFKNKFLSVILISIFPFYLFFSYPYFSFFRQTPLLLTKIIPNLFTLFSFEMLFFRNITFYWGGIREFGFMYLTFLPLFLIGLISFPYSLFKNFLFLSLVFAILAIFSAQFPESRFLYLASPFLSVIVAWGILVLGQNKKILNNTVIYFLILFLIYELGQFFHYYYIHYPKDISSNTDKLPVPF
ncbi:hypothetical protein A2W14_01920 [Candidatus Gottesmanbacteria bacterium RBG_16_37_8]|uniref:ArnT-like N-terminal domain-containing protein n=1 Tax=Candidatus Gottesmanbacteria bacterium RBG_16_37_8 TaxID=1798371 RepID=A0A1F5YWB3_9BACT|nr:MAG: hypothetical protein A2W14_01920 [Candidatus Gottesmanbacteria bacterium RBG_16_37_8]